MVFSNVDDKNIEEVLECVEKKNKKGKGFRGFGEAMSAIPECVDSNFPNMHEEDKEELSRAAERWMEDDFSQPQAVLQTSEGRKELTRYTSPMGFRAEWSSTDAWRGHYTIKSPKGWTKLKSDTILSMHPSEKDLHDMHEAIVDAFDRSGVKYVVAFPRTSNVFATGYDLYVRKSDKKRATNIIQDIADKQGQRGFL